MTTNCSLLARILYIINILLQEMQLHALAACITMIKDNSCLMSLPDEQELSPDSIVRLNNTCPSQRQIYKFMTLPV